MTNLWVDANVLLRLITDDPKDFADRASHLAEQAEQGHVTLKISPIVVAEIVWVLTSFYKYSRIQVAEVLIPLMWRTAPPRMLTQRYQWTSTAKPFSSTSPTTKATPTQSKPSPLTNSSSMNPN